MKSGNLLEKGLSFFKTNSTTKIAKTIFITGCSSGIGKATVLYFAKQGWNVAATMRNRGDAIEFENLPNVKAFTLDVTIPEQIENAVQHAITYFGKIDVVLNNAGMCMFGALEHASEDNIDRQWHVNVKGVIDVIRAFLPHFKQVGSGKFITISSIAGLTTVTPLSSLYSMSKFAVEGLMEGLYYELKPLNIESHLIEPGSYRTAVADNAKFDYRSEIPGYDQLVKCVKNLFHNADKFERGEPNEIAEVVYNLATGKSKKFRTVVGKDAVQALSLRTNMPIEEYLEKTATYFK